MIARIDHAKGQKGLIDYLWKCFAMFALGYAVTRVLHVVLFENMDFAKLLSVSWSHIWVALVGGYFMCGFYAVSRIMEGPASDYVGKPSLFNAQAQIAVLYVGIVIAPFPAIAVALWRLYKLHQAKTWR